MESRTQLNFRCVSPMSLCTTHDATRSPAGVASLLGLVVVGTLTALAVLLIDYQDLVIYIGLISVFVHAVSQATEQLSAAIESLGAACDAALIFILVTFCYSLARAGDSFALEALEGGTVGSGAWEAYVVGATHISLVSVGLSPVLLFVPRFGFIRWFAQNRYVASALRIAGSPAVRRTSFAVYSFLVVVLLSNAYACFQLLRETGLANEEVVLFLVLYALLVAATFTASFERLMDIPLAALLSRSTTLPLLRALRYESVLHYSTDSNVAQTILGWADEAARLSTDGDADEPAAHARAPASVPAGTAAASRGAALLRAAAGWRHECSKKRVLEIARWAEETAKSARDALDVVHGAGELGVPLEAALAGSLVSVGAHRAPAHDASSHRAHGLSMAATERAPTVFEAARLLAAQVDAALPVAQEAARSLNAATRALALAAASAFAAGVQAWAEVAEVEQLARGGGPPAPAPRGRLQAQSLPWWGGSSLLLGSAASTARQQLASSAEQAAQGVLAANAQIHAACSGLAEAAAALARLDRLAPGARALVAMGGRVLVNAVVHSHSASALARLDTAMATAERAGEVPSANLARALLPSGDGAEMAMHALLAAGGKGGGDGGGKLVWQHGGKGASDGDEADGSSTVGRIGARLRGSTQEAVALVQRLQTRMCARAACCEPPHQRHRPASPCVRARAQNGRAKPRACHARCDVSFSCTPPIPSLLLWCSGAIVRSCDRI